MVLFSYKVTGYFTGYTARRTKGMEEELHEKDAETNQGNGKTNDGK